MMHKVTIVHEEDFRIKLKLAEARISKAIDITNNLLRLANKSMLPP